MAVEYKEFDQNVIVNATIGNVEVELFDVRTEPFDLYGLFDAYNMERERFTRMPEDVAGSISEGVKIQSFEPAGGKVRFCTDSDYVAIKVEMAWMTNRPHFTFIEAAGFDMYVDIDGKEYLQGVFIPPHNAVGGYETKIRFQDNKRKYITINFPVHACVKKLLVGLRPGSFLGHGKKFINEKPVVCYGSSITQGTGTSRPGMVYGNILSQRMNVNTYNLGFSGQCKGEPAMAHYIAGLDMAALIFDYDENAPTPEHLEQTHEPFFRIIREKHPDLPVIMLSRPSIPTRAYLHKPFRDVVYKTYTNAVAAGDQNVYFIDGMEYVKENGGDECILDCIHPNDHGVFLMANQIQKHLETIIAKSKDFRKV